MTTSVLVAFRDSSEEQWRRRLWDFIRARLRVDHPDFEIIEGSDDGTDPFCKSAAINQAAEHASGDIFYILDCDSYVPPGQVLAAVSCIQILPGHWWKPWQMKVKLNAKDTEEVLGLEAWDGTVSEQAVRKAENRNTYWSSPPLLLSREMFERVGGMDERFRGWGQEDDGFGYSLRAFYGLAEKIPGRAIHLHHPRIGRSGFDQWPGQERSGTNVPLAIRYRRAARKPELMDALIAERETVGVSA
jgi:predicted glycosyltransferase involved in capsule biosynthesis